MNTQSVMENLSQQEILSSLLNACKTQLKTAKKAKAEVAVQFKNAASGTPEHALLITAMQTVSTELKTVEQKIKDIEKQMLATPEIKNDIHNTPPPLLTISQEKYWEGDMSIRELHMHEMMQWYSFVATIPNATAYHQSAWQEVIAAAFANPTRVWAAFNLQGEIVGGIPLTFFKSALFGKFAVSMPYVNYGGVISLYFNVAKKLVDYLTSVCLSENLSHIEVRTMQPELASAASSKKASMILPLPKTSEELDKNLGSKIRAQYKKAEEHHPEICFGKLDLVNDFYKVFAKNMRDLGTPVYSKKWFVNILKHQDINATLAIVYVRSKPVSAAFLVGFNGMLEIPWASTLKEANALNTNMWMYRKILDFAIQQHFNFFDFGRSTQDAGTYKFKKQWGTIPYLHYWYRITPTPSAQAPELNPDNPKFALMIAIWKKLPIWVSTIIGPPIIRNIP
jgi:serine/alanine adding enzyme